MTFSAHFDNKQKGIASPLLIGGVVVIGIIVFLIASGTLKLSGYVKVDDQNQNKTEIQNEQSTPTEKPKLDVKLNPEPFTDSKLGFSISYPEGWKVDSATTNATIYKPSETKGANKADAIITIFSGSAGELQDTKLATIADLHKVQLKKLFSDVNIINEGATKVGDQDAYEMEFTGVMNGENMHGKYIVMTSPTKLYAILAGANVGLWNDIKSTLDASIQTFKKQ